MYLNDFDLDTIRRFDNSGKPNLEKLGRIVRNLADWVNDNSDGWAYWRRPQSAVKQASEHLYREYLGRWSERTGEDITEDQLKKALTPIKAFLTRYVRDADTISAILEK